MLTVDLALSPVDLDWARQMIVKYHYLESWPHNQSRPMTYIVKYWDFNGLHRRAYYVGVVTVGIPHATKNKGWWGHEGLPTQWQVLDLSRIWLDPQVQAGGEYCKPGLVPGFTDRKGVWRPAAATWVIRNILDRVQVDRVSLWPPVYPAQPYHIRLVVSYCDPDVHRGEIYRNAKAKPLYTADDGTPAPGSAGKMCWYWKLPEPSWSWEDIEIVRPRTMRLL